LVAIAHRLLEQFSLDAPQNVDKPTDRKQTINQV
jgi:hypothetical protein